MENNLPEQIYLQAYSEDGQLLNASKGEVTWCVDQINENDAAYVLATPELVALLERLANGLTFSCIEQEYRDSETARALAARIKEALDDSQA